MPAATDRRRARIRSRTDGSGPRRTATRVRSRSAAPADRPAEPGPRRPRRTSPACARASRSPRDRAVQRSGCGMAVMTPRSGQVPTTTAAPPRRRRRTAAPSRRADGPMPLSAVTSLAPIMITAASGGGSGHQHRVDLTRQAPSTSRPRSPSSTAAPAVRSARPARGPAKPRELRRRCRQPYPVAVESPNTIRCRSTCSHRAPTGGPVHRRARRPRPRGAGCPRPCGMMLRACSACPVQKVAGTHDRAAGRGQNARDGQCLGRTEPHGHGTQCGPAKPGLAITDRYQFQQ